MLHAALALLLAATAAACAASAPSGLPTAPTAGARGRTEVWQLALTVRTVLGTDCDHPALGATRLVELQMDFADDGTVTMRYGHPGRPSVDAASLTGWTLDDGFEGAGVAYEGLPCSGAALELAGAPTTLTGYFSADGRTFEGVEVRRYLNRPMGDIVYHLEWRAAQ